MPRRTASSSRFTGLTAHRSGECVWVSDYFLAKNFNQFFGIVTYDQRRGGSHVPGPLEHRSRGHRRRIALAAGLEDFKPKPTWSWKPFLNFGAIFDNRPIDARWTWLAPRILEESEELELQEQVTSGPQLPTTIEIDRPLDELLAQCQTIDDIRVLHWRTCPLGEEVDRFVIPALQRVLKMSSEIWATDPSQASRQIQDFLASGIADNTRGIWTNILEWHATLPFQDALHARTMRHHLMKNALLDLFHRAAPLESVADLVGALRTCVDNPKSIGSDMSLTYMDVRSILLKTSRWIGDQNPTPEVHALADDLVYVTRAFDMARSRLSDLWRIVSRLPHHSRDTHSSAAIEELVGFVKHTQPQAVDGTTNTATQSRMALYQLIDKLCGHFGVSPDVDAWLVNALSEATCKLASLARSDHTVTTQSYRWIEALRGKGKSEPLAQHIHRIWARVVPFLARESREMTTITSQMGRDYLAGSEDPVIKIDRSAPKSTTFQNAPASTALIQQALSQGDPLRALFIFERSPYVTLASCKSLLLALANEGYDVLDTYIKILRRRDPGYLRDEQGSREGGRRDRQSAEMVDALVTAISLNESISDRQALRIVWRLYGLTLRRGEKITSTMSRALVRSGITRFLMKRLPVRNDRTSRILQIVADVEGQHTARLLGNVIVRWLSTDGKSTKEETRLAWKRRREQRRAVKQRKHRSHVVRQCYVERRTPASSKYALRRTGQRPLFRIRGREIFIGSGSPGSGKSR